MSFFIATLNTRYLATGDEIKRVNQSVGRCSVLRRASSGLMGHYRFNKFRILATIYRLLSLQIEHFGQIQCSSHHLRHCKTLRIACSLKLYTLYQY